LTADTGPQVSAGSILKREEGVVAEYTYVIDLHDVGMVQAANGFGLETEACQFQEAGDSCAKDHLESDKAVVIQLPGLVHDAHASPAQFAQDLITGDARQDLLWWDAAMFLG
jgi:hypothetical protein